MADDKKRGLGHNLRDNRVDLSGHDGRAVLHGRKDDFRKARFRAGGKEPQVIGHFGQADCACLQRAGNRGKAVRVLGCVKQVPGLIQRVAGQLRQIRNHVGQVSSRNIDCRTDCRAAKIDAVHFLGGQADAVCRAFYHGGVAAEGLAEAHRNRVL